MSNKEQYGTCPICGADIESRDSKSEYDRCIGGHVFSSNTADPPRAAKTPTEAMQAGVADRLDEFAARVKMKLEAMRETRTRDLIKIVIDTMSLTGDQAMDLAKDPERLEAFGDTVVRIDRLKRLKRNTPLEPSRPPAEDSTTDRVMRGMEALMRDIDAEDDDGHDPEPVCPFSIQSRTCDWKDFGPAVQRCRRCGAERPKPIPEAEALAAGPVGDQQGKDTPKCPVTAWNEPHDFETFHGANGTPVRVCRRCMHTELLTNQVQLDEDPHAEEIWERA